jgi:Ca2+-binding EF-hand superfamily protein
MIVMTTIISTPPIEPSVGEENDFDRSLNAVPKENLFEAGTSVQPEPWSELVPDTSQIPTTDVTSMIRHLKGDDPEDVRYSAYSATTDGIMTRNGFAVARDFLEQALTMSDARQAEEIRSVLRLADGNEDGMIDDAEAEKFVDWIDADDNQTISIEEFMDFVSARVTEQENDELNVA